MISSAAQFHHWYAVGVVTSIGCKRIASECLPSKLIRVRGERGPKVVPVGEAGLSSARQSGDRARLPCHRASGMPSGAGWSSHQVVSACPDESRLWRVPFRNAMYRTVQTRNGITPVVATCDTLKRTEPPHLEDTCPRRAFRLPAFTQLPSASCAQAPSRPKAAQPGTPTRQPRCGGIARSERRGELCRCRAQIDHQSVMADASALVSLAILIPYTRDGQIA
jgi:hypothetical protein